MSDIYSHFRETPLKTPITPHQSRYPYTQNAHYTPLKANDMVNEQSEHIYGTNINVRKVMAGIQKFILEYEETNPVDGEYVTQKIYRTKLADLENTQTNIFEVQGKHIKEFDKQLYLQLNYFPAEMISCFDEVIKEIYEKYFIEPETDITSKRYKKIKKGSIMMGIKNLDEEQNLQVKHLGPRLIGRLVNIKGIVIRSSDIMPQMKSAFFICSVCKHSVFMNLENAKVKEPSICDVCQNRNSFEIEHNLSVFTDKQYIKLQELPQCVMEGETPSALTILAYDNNVDSFRPGDRVEIIGIYRASPKMIEKTRGSIRTIFNTYVDLISLSILKENKLKADDDKAVFSDQQKRLFHSMAAKQSIINDLVKSLAPSIYGCEQIKKGILSQLFGGVKKHQMGPNMKGRFRPDINICLIGDPSTSKSQILQQVHKIAPRSIYTSGRGSSAVGLTANVRKDPQTFEFILESGALVLSDQGICCIDQFDKMDDNSRNVLLQAMEQQTISIAKAGIVCQLNSRTAILAAANPLHSKYDPTKSIIENINLSPSLLSRFDLIFIILDIPNEKSDKLLASHILDFYTGILGMNPEISKRPTYSMEILTKYITYAKEYVQPQITDQAAQQLKKQYEGMRGLGMSRKTITATPRQLESLIRISEAFAKMRLSRTVQVQDVNQAVTLMLEGTLRSATDPTTGIIDLDIITTGRSSSIKSKIRELSEHIKNITEANDTKYRKAVHMEQLIEDLKEVGLMTSYSREEVKEALKMLQTNDIVAIFGQNKNNPQFKLQRASNL